MLNVYHSPAQLFHSFHLSLAANYQLQRLSQLHQISILLQFPLPAMVIPTGATHDHRAFYYHGSGFPFIL